MNLLLTFQCTYQCLRKVVMANLYAMAPSGIYL